MRTPRPERVPSEKHARERERRARLPDAEVPPGCDPDSVVLTFEVPNELDGQRLDRFLSWRIPRLTRSRAGEITRACAVLPDGTRRAPSDRVRAGETVLLVRERFVEPDAPREFGVIHQDAHVVVVDKPAGLPIHPSATYHRNTLTHLLLERFGEGGPRIVHRLDKETSGLVVCGMPGDAMVRLNRQFETREVDKEYLAIVRGRIASDEGVIDVAMRPVTSGLHLLMEVHPDGLSARTAYRVVERRDTATLVHLFPETGRQHQLRVHLASIGHPILGDKLYGPEREAAFLENIETGMTPALLARLGHSRHALHAHRVGFVHPATGERVFFVSPLPADLVDLWSRS
jgi:23S rRNA pseudouridine1911/1915/1917 synthase